mmetsp:Transcript_57482/g.160019  ORF Transcript_57482/g.160019 Transcript_57482/m.160019 type:complete len:208 (+) Transcript_57482:1076-1699(+)
MSACMPSESSRLTKTKASFFLFDSSLTACLAAFCSGVRARSSMSLFSALMISPKSTSVSFATSSAATKSVSSSLFNAACSCSYAARLSRSCAALSSRRASSTRASTAPMAFRSSGVVAFLLVITYLSRPSEHSCCSVAFLSSATSWARASFSSRRHLSSACTFSCSSAETTFAWSLLRGASPSTPVLGPSSASKWSSSPQTASRSSA